MSAQTCLAQVGFSPLLLRQIAPLATEPWDTLGRFRGTSWCTGRLGGFFERECREWARIQPCACWLDRA